VVLIKFIGQIYMTLQKLDLAIENFKLDIDIKHQPRVFSIEKVKNSLLTVENSK
jgi:hypothetical protein